MNITLIICGFVTIIFGIVGKWLVPVIKVKTTLQQRQAFMTFAKALVESAEQMFTGEKRGKEKINYALIQAEKFLEEKGIEMNEEEIRAILESEVYKLKKELNE